MLHTIATVVCSTLRLVAIPTESTLQIYVPRLIVNYSSRVYHSSHFYAYIHSVLIRRHTKAYKKILSTTPDYSLLCSLPGPAVTVCSAICHRMGYSCMLHTRPPHSPPPAPSTSFCGLQQYIQYQNDRSDGGCYGATLCVSFVIHYSRAVVHNYDGSGGLLLTTVRTPAAYVE